MGKKLLFINLIANIIAFGTSLLISFVLTPYLITNVGKEAYSFYPISTNFVNYLTIITIALNSMASRFITIELVKERIESAKTYYASVFFANVFMSLVLILPMLFIVIFLDSFLNIPAGIVYQVKLLFGLVFASMIVSVVTSVFGVATYAKNRLDLRSGGEIFQGLLKILIYVILFTIFKPSIVFIGLAAFVLSITNLIIQVFFTRKLLPTFKLSFNYFNMRAVKELLTSGVWNSINSLGSILLLGVTLLLANIFIDASASGELSIIQTLPQFISAIIMVLFSVFMPRITYVYAEGDQTALVDEITFSQKVIGLLSTTPIILIIIFGKEFFSLWVPLENSGKLQMLSTIAIIPLIIHGNMWTVYGLNIVLNKVKIPSLVLIGFGVLNLIICYIALVVYNGSVYVLPLVSTIISVIYYFFFIPTYAAKQLKVKLYQFQIHILKAIFFAIVGVIVGMYFKQNVLITSWLGFFIWGGIFGFVGLLVNALFILSKEDFRKLKLLIFKNK
jgi:O-antigen/teichoic acid export membrane protein